MGSAVRCAVLHACLLALRPVEGFRSQGSDSAVMLGADTAGTQFGCQTKTSCATCLTASPFVGHYGSYCQWCPADNWLGASGDVHGKPGICATASAGNSKCGGSGWHFAWELQGKPPFTVRAPKVAVDRNATEQFCPRSVNNRSASWRVHTLSRMSAADLTAIFNDTRVLTELLGKINMDLERLDTLHAVNPVLFDSHFSPSYAKTAGKWAWKVAVFTTNFVDVTGLSFAVGMASEAVGDALALAEEQGRSQSALISKGADTDVSYFQDVTFGNLNSAYKAIFHMNGTEVEEKLHTIVGSGLAGRGGKVAGTFQSISNSAAMKAGKAALQTGLFVGGFFTAGITWIVGMGIGAAELAADGSAAAGVSAALKVKMQMLVGMARSMDESVWNASAGDVCDITSWYEGRDPCPPRRVPGVKEPMRRVCSRFSPWGNQRGIISGQPGDPEGRCLPAASRQLSVGMPCLTHASCSSGLCHFEPRLQYFFSDHERRHCAADDESCLSATEQLATLEGVVPILPEQNFTNSSAERKARAIVELYDSYDGVTFASTGTCAVACPSSMAGSGDCEALTHRRVAGGSFGIRREHRLFAGDEGFIKVGNGSCVGASGPMAANLTKSLSSRGARLVEECARLCAESGLAAFDVDDEASSCRLFARHVWKVAPRDGSVCFERRAGWPFNAYQPWNSGWRKYKRDLAQVTHLLEAGQGLEQVRKAYKHYCTVKEKHWYGNRNKHLNASESDCPFPDTWDLEQAKAMLWSVAPLSASQLHALHASLSPKSAQATATGSASAMVSREELEERPEGFGEAWRRFLAGSQHDESAKGISRAVVERFEALAEEADLRMADGSWDLAAAGQMYLHDMGLSNSPQ